MEIANKDYFRIRELIEIRERETNEKKVPVKSDFQYIFESACRNISGHAQNEWRI